MRMNEISWQRKVYMNHSANVVPAGKPYKKQNASGKKSFLSLKHRLGTLF